MGWRDIMINQKLKLYSTSIILQIKESEKLDMVLLNSLNHQVRSYNTKLSILAKCITYLSTVFRPKCKHCGVQYLKGVSYNKCR